MRQVGQIATAAEIHSAKVYWHLDDANIVYPEIIKEKRMLGILWQNLAQYQTWFGGQAYMVHGIQMIPVTPITEIVSDAEFTRVEYPVFAQSCGGGGQCLTDGWITFAVMTHAILDAVRAARALRARTREHAARAARAPRTIPSRGARGRGALACDGVCGMHACRIFASVPSRAIARIHWH